jgi:hypothetical protein
MPNGLSGKFGQGSLARGMLLPTWVRLTPSHYVSSRRRLESWETEFAVKARTS